MLRCFCLSRYLDWRYRKSVEGGWSFWLRSEFFRIGVRVCCCVVEIVFGERR